MSSTLLTSETHLTQASLRPAMVDGEKASYGDIVRSSALVGGAQILNIAIGVVRTKAMAVLLGPAGFGLAGLYNSIPELTQSVIGLGVNSSGVRQIAEAVASDDVNRISITAAVLRRTSVVLGLVAAALLVIFRQELSSLTFGTPKYSTGVAILSTAAFCKLVSGGQGALIQGMRRIADLAKMNVLGALLGALFSIALVYLFRENGIVPYLITVTGISVLMSWWYSRKIKIPSFSVSVRQVRTEVRALLKLGVAFMISTLMTLGVAYIVRVIVTRRVGVAGTGLYQSAWTLGGMYVGFILQAMGADFYPRLTARINHHNVCNRLVNEQAQVGLLLATPGVLGTLTFAPVVIAALYSGKFADSVPILRWICLGTMLQVITWPMGFIIVAKGKQNLFIFCEVVWAVVSVLLSWNCIARFGLKGTGIAFFLSYAFHGILLYPIVRRMTGFFWSKENVQTGILFFSMVGIVFYSFHALSAEAAVGLGSCASIFSAVYSARKLLNILSPNDIPGSIRRLLARYPKLRSPMLSN